MSDFQRPRGTRDFPPEDMERRRNVEMKLRHVAHDFGFREVMTPIFEDTDLFVARSGQQVVDDMYAFEDKANRQISLRPEITASVIRFYVNELHTRPKPLKLYYMGNCFRYERPQSGRYREFFQFGAEIIGSPSLESDAEILALAVGCVKTLGLKNVKLRVGHLGVLKSYFDYIEMPEELQIDVRRLIDKKDFDNLGALLAERGIDDEEMNRLVELVSLQGDEKVLKKAKKIVLSDKGSFDYLSQLLERLAGYGVDDIDLDFGVARGLDYYSGMVFEIDAFALGAEKQVCGGGSYTLSEVFGGEPIFSTGFAFGFDRLVLAMEKEGISIPTRRLQAYVIPISESAKIRCLEITTELRSNGISADFELMGRKISKSLAYANSQNVKSVIIVGDREMAEETATVRDMKTGEQKSLKFAELVNHFTN
jgi:histidyl-tRNA synthetase